LRHEIILKYATLTGMLLSEAWFLWNPKGWTFGWEPIVCFVGLLGFYLSLDVKYREKDRKKTVSLQPTDVSESLAIKPDKSKQKSIEKKDIQLKSSNMSLGEYFHRLKALKNRFLEKTEFIESINGSHVSWKATVKSVSRDNDSGIVLHLKPLETDLVVLYVVAQLPPEFETKAFSLRKGDKVIVEGILNLYLEQIPMIKTDSLNVFTS